VSVHLEDWGEDDLPLVEALMGDPAMTEYLGGPESPKKLLDRQQRYFKPETNMFKIVDDETGAAVGSVGFWDYERDGMTVSETGWSVLPAFQGRGYATAAMRLVIERAGSARPLYAFPRVDNAASNALCKKLGFECIAQERFEFPKGTWMTGNVWRLVPELSGGMRSSGGGGGVLP
jgi:RimJ/RimL family protein N-acetyltransferase